MKRLFVTALVSATLSSGASCAETAFIASIRCIGGTYGLDLPQDARKLKSLDTLLRKEVSEVEHWDGYTATRTTLFFDGFELGIVEFSNDPARVMVTYADITKPSWNRLAPFKLGWPASEAQALLGASASGDDGLKRTYGGESDSVEFDVVSGVLARVSYSCYSG